MARGKRTETEQDTGAETEAQDDTPATAETDTVETGDAADVEAALAPRRDPGDTSETDTGEDPTDSDTPETVATDDDDVTAPDEPDRAAEDEGAPVAATPTITAHPDRQVSGPGFLPLLFGGILAGAIGYGAGYLVFHPGASFDVVRMAELTSTVSAQGEAIDELSTRTQALAEAAPPDVDLSALETGIADLQSALSDMGERIDEIDGALSGIDTRVSDLEDRPVLTGEAGTDEAAVAAAMDRLRAELGEQRDANEALAERVQTLADEAEARVAEAEQRIADAEARAEASMGEASAQAALSELRIAVAAGTPFAAALADLPGTGEDLPAPLAEVAETGIPTLEELQSRFPAAARAALPIAIRETAGDTASDRVTAFLRSQVGGRSLEPREGDDPDAILSRAGAAVEVGDLDAALAEIAALPEPAQAAMSDWIAMAEQRAEALTALESLSSALGGN
ncbi:hypothetical protein HKCCE2091_12035 [Rhodobacterales bacterium HKCCE2091]|nr:hypothetical protein [Rhodobacterales bacterium HKCCE2091]